jgi:hypothetical protein
MLARAERVDTMERVEVDTPTWSLEPLDPSMATYQSS